MSPAPSSRPSANIWHLALLWLLVPLFIAVLALAFFQWSYQYRIYPGVQALGVDLSGMNREAAVSTLTAASATFDLPPLALRHGDQVWPLKAKELGVAVDVDRVVAQAFALGRGGKLFENLGAQTKAFWWGQIENPALKAQPGAVTAVVAERTASLNHPVTEPRLSLSDLQVVISAPRPGQMVDVEATREEVLERVETGRGGVVDVVVRELTASDADVSAGQEAIQELLDEPIILADTRGEFQFALDPATLAVVLDWEVDDDAPGGVRPSVQEDRLREVVEVWAEQVARPPLNARFDFSSKFNTLIELSPSADGYALDVEATMQAILDAINLGETQVVLPVQVIRPAVASDDIDSLGITELVAEGSTRFAGSAEARVKNIEVAASKFVGVVIPPGEVFSFNEHVGDVTAANGFEDSLIIAGDTTAVGVGGGVCQVSTTVFRAAWNGGLPIEERWNHGYVVSWYGEPGLDATIYTPTVDFKFRNTTEHHLLIKPVVDSANGVLIFQFYGTNPGWQVEAPAPVQKEKIAPPPPLYVEDPELPPGKVVQFDWSVEGMDAVAKRQVVAADGSIIQNDTLTSHYLPWQAKFRFGSGFTPPANAEVVWANR